MSKRDLYQGTDAWRAERRTGYGASDAAVLVEGDEMAWRQLHAQKLGLIPDREATETMELGHRLEDVIAQIAAERIGEPLIRVNRIIRHPEYRFVFASLDRRRKRGDRRPVEVKKWAIKGDDWGQPGSDVVPVKILYQVQQQAAVVGADAVDVAVLFGGSRLEVFTVGRDQTLIDELLELEVAAWAFVARGEIPPWPGQAPRRITLATDEIEVDATLANLVELYQGADQRAKAAEQELDDAKDRIRAVLADVGGAKGVLPDGRRVSISHRPQALGERTAWDLVAAGYRRRLVQLGVSEQELDFASTALTVTEQPRRPLRINVKEIRHAAA